MSDVVQSFTYLDIEEYHTSTLDRQLKVEFFAQTGVSIDKFKVIEVCGSCVLVFFDPVKFVRPIHDDPFVVMINGCRDQRYLKNFKNVCLYLMARDAKRSSWLRQQLVSSSVKKYIKACQSLNMSDQEINYLKSEMLDIASHWFYAKGLKLVNGYE